MSRDVSQIAHLFLSNVGTSAEAPKVRALLAGHMAEAAGVIRKITQHWARQLGSAALLECKGREVSLRLFSTEDNADGDDPKRPTVKDSKGLGEALADLAGQTSLVLVAIDNDESNLLDRCEEISVAASADPETMVAAYRQIKKLRPKRGKILGLTLVDCSSVAQGQQLAERLRQTTQEFLDAPLRLDAIVLRNSRLRERKLAQIRTVDERVLSEGISLLLGRRNR